MKIIVDTNIAVDIMAHRDEFLDDSAKVFTFCCSGLIDGFFTASAFSDLHYIMKKHIHDEESVRSSLCFWMNFIGILDVDFEDCKKALRSTMNDYEDALLSEVAKRHGVDYIVTRNVGDFKNSPVPAVTPKEFIPIAMRQNL